jgi:hypothetical protein
MIERLTPRHHGLSIHVDPQNEVVSLEHLGHVYPIPRHAWVPLAGAIGIDMEKAVKDSGTQSFCWRSFREMREQCVALTELLKLSGQKIYLSFFEFDSLFGESRGVL